jgi:sugar lactone lactonase YvrE
MKLTIFGATGRIGGHLLTWAVDAGHDVHVLARSPQALRPRDGLTVTGPIQAGARRTAGINKYSRSIRRILVLTLAAAVSLLAAAQHADAASGPISNPHIIAHLDFSRGQTPENLALEPDGSADVTFAEAAQVARVSPDGQVRILAQLPAPTGGAVCPFFGPFLGKAAVTSGIVRDHHGSLYIALCTGSPDLQGIWRVSQNGSASRIAALPADSAPNGMALDERHGFIYVADSLLSTIWRVSIADGTVVAWALGPQLAPSGGLGANGLKLHGGAVWVSNTQLGTLLRIPIRADGSAGPIETIASGLAGIDDFAFTGPGQSASVLAAINPFSAVVLIRPDGSEQTVLTAADGLSNPSSVAIRGSTVYVLSAGYLTRNDPNILLASLHR